jgi:hypothetical protein
MAGVDCLTRCEKAVCEMDVYGETCIGAEEALVLLPLLTCPRLW